MIVLARLLLLEDMLIGTKDAIILLDLCLSHDAFASCFVVKSYYVVASPDTVIGVSSFKSKNIGVWK